MSDEELRQLVASNARAIQAMQDARVEERLQFQETIVRLEDNTVASIASAVNRDS